MGELSLGTGSSHEFVNREPELDTYWPNHKDEKAKKSHRLKVLLKFFKVADFSIEMYCRRATSCNTFLYGNPNLKF